MLDNIYYTISIKKMQENQNPNTKYYLGLAKIPCIGPVKFKKLQKTFLSLDQAWNAPISILSEIGFSESNIAEFFRLRNEINLDQEMEKHEKEGISILTIEDQAYPKLLKETYDPPFVLFYRGKAPSNNDFTLAVVGSRKFSEYGKQATETIVRSLARAGLTIVSGLAFGIDAIAHKACL